MKILKSKVVRAILGVLVALGALAGTVLDLDTSASTHVTIEQLTEQVQE